MPELGIIVLAAGASSRMGQSKLTLDWKGLPMVRHVVETALGVCPDHTLVVTGGHEHDVTQALDGLNCIFVSNPNFADGISTSIHAGIRGSLDCGSVIILLADQPTVTKLHLRNLILASKPDSVQIVATGYGDGIGVPCLFKASQFARLLALKGDQGAKRLLNEFGEEVAVVPLKTNLPDVDTLADYQALTKQKGSQP